MRDNPVRYFLARGCYPVFAILLLLSGCATQPPVSQSDKTEQWLQHQARINTIRDWTLTGRIAIQLEKDGGSASLYWKQAGGDYFLRFIAPFGRGTYELSGNEQGVSLRTNDNRILSARDPESLLQQNLGWHVPISGLVYWIRGLSQPGAGVLSLDEKGRLEELAQSGWQVNYQHYVTIKGVDMPGKLSLENEQLKVRLLIKEWEFSL